MALVTISILTALFQAVAYTSRSSAREVWGLISEGTKYKGESGAVERGGHESKARKGRENYHKSRAAGSLLRRIITDSFL